MGRRSISEKFRMRGTAFDTRYYWRAVGVTDGMTIARRQFLTGGIAIPAAAARGKRVLLLNRIGPVASQIFLSGADGTNERKVVDSGTLDYNGSFSPDGQWIVFTSERDGLGNANLYRCRVDGSGAERLTDSPAVDDAAVVSPDGTRIAFVSTRNSLLANLWILDLRTRRLRNLTGNAGVAGKAGLPGGFFRPAWSSDGQWIAFSSDRNTEWTGHHGGAGWEHTQELSIYAIRPDGTGFRRVSARPGYCQGSPRWSRDGKRIVFYEALIEYTYWALRPNLVAQTVSQIVSVDVTTGQRIEHTSGPGFKIAPQYLTADEIAYRRKGGPEEGLYSTAGSVARKVKLRSPVWSPDGRTVLYERFTFGSLPQNRSLYSWEPNVEYRHTDTWPVFSKDGKLVLTEKADNSSIAIMDADGSNRKRIFDVSNHVASAKLNPKLVGTGLVGAFAPAWSADGEWIVFGLGHWFTERDRTARLMRIRRDGSGLEELTDGTMNSGFPSCSADGKEIVFRVWTKDVKGLHILNLATRKTRILTVEYDNLPSWSPDGRSILFTRRVETGTKWGNFDICTIRPDGSGFRRLTDSLAVDGHAVWTNGGRQILYNSAEHGYRDEAVLYDNTFQPYGQVYIMNADGSNKRQITDSPWEDSTPQYVPG